MRSLPYLMLWFLFVLTAAGSVLAQTAGEVTVTPQADLVDKVEQLRQLLGSEQGAAILDLLGDPKIREEIAQQSSPNSPSRSQPPATAGEMMDSMLSGVRIRLWGLAKELGRLPDELAQLQARMQSLLPGSELFRLVGSLIAFLAGGIGAQRLFHRLAWPWRAHFDKLTLASPHDRARAVSERLLFATLYILAFAAGSMGTFLLFAWPPLTGSILLGYLLAFLAIRLAMAATRFFLAPGAERLRLLPVSTETAWFWHHWVARLIGTAGIGWQTILTLRSLGMSQSGVDLLVQLLLLLLTCLGLSIIWTMPARTDAAAPPARGPVARMLASAALVIDWLLFLMGASQLGLTLLILAAAPIAAMVLSRSISTVIIGREAQPDTEPSAYEAIAERTMQALVVMLTAAALVRVWHLDMTAMSNMDTPMMRVARGLLEALVILVGADLLWQVVRVLIDSRLAGEQVLDDLDGDAMRRRARLRTLLPVLRNFALFLVLVMASLSALAAMGLQIGPLLAGAGVVGIAVGFGAQTLVRDILSGVFFLLDDAFRVGEHIESGGIRGTVESFSLRSVKLRHLNGQLHTVPFGDLKAITNYSRDWVVDHVQFVVTFDTDLDLLDRIVDAVSDELTADPVLAPEMIEPLRSLGVQAITDTGMQVGLMFKTRPGRQFGVRRAVLSRIKAAFAAHGIRFASVVVTQPAGGVEATENV